MHMCGNCVDVKDTQKPDEFGTHQAFVRAKTVTTTLSPPGTGSPSPFRDLFDYYSLQGAGIPHGTDP